MIIRNHRELQEVCQSEEFGRLFITPDAEQKIMDSLKLNVELLVSSYGEDGSGGYISIIPHSISTEKGESEYLAELAKFNLEPDAWEYDDLLAKSELEEVRLRLYILTEQHLLLLYVKQRE